MQGELRYVLYCRWLFTREACSGFSRKRWRSQAATYRCAQLSYLAGVLLVQVEAYCSPCSLDGKTIGGSSYKSLLTSERGGSWVSTSTVLSCAENGSRARRYAEGSKIKKPSVEVIVSRRQIRQLREPSCSPVTLAEQPLQPTKCCVLEAAKRNCDACWQERQGVQSYAPCTEQGWNLPGSTVIC